jgi:transposase
MARWAQAVRSRDQIVLFAPTLEDAIPGDHPVRLFDEVLGRLDFSDWQRRYFLLDGQPPIHPRVMASVILYGLSLGVRASRKLEYACGNNIDFIWLTEGRVIDHSTLALFRVKFEVELKGMFRQIGRVAIGMGMANLNQVALDGTVKRANNSRFAVARQNTLEQKIAALDQRVEQLMTEATAADKKDDELFGESSPTQLPKQLKDIQARQKRLAAALKKVRETAAKQEAKGRKSEKGPAVPTTDPDAGMIKNKTGGTAPNYQVVLTTEGESGLIMDYQTLGHDDEPSAVMPAIENLKAAYQSGELAQAEEVQIKELLADSNFNTGPNLEQLKQAGVEPWMAAKSPGLVKPAEDRDAAASAALPVATPSEAADRLESAGNNTSKLPPNTDALPISARTRALDKSAFTYDKQADAYHCPGGRSLPLFKHATDKHPEGPLHYDIYRSTTCGGCALMSKCLSGKNIGPGSKRTIRRDEHEPLREEMAARMAAEAGRAKYKRRSFLAETPFAVFNTTMNIRQLLLRGLNKVNTEIGWICSASNLKKITRLLAAQRLATA